MFRGLSRFLSLVILLSAWAVVALSLLLSQETTKASADSDDRNGVQAEVAYQKTVTVEIGDGVMMEFVLIPPGTFTMGSPPEEEGRNRYENQHMVEITQPFCLGKFPVTQQQYQAVMNENPSRFQAGHPGADRVRGLDTKQFPVEDVSWDDAQVYCKKLRENDKQRRKFRLPTEAEWEYACRAGTKTPFHFGSCLNGTQANCDGDFPYGTKEKGPSLQRPTKVGNYPPNGWGLHDMHGNVRQACADYYSPYEGLTQKDPLRSIQYERNFTGGTAYICRVYRGGDWANQPWCCRAADRSFQESRDHWGNYGFRVAFTLK